MSFQLQHTFTHQGLAFTIEADDWPDEKSAAAAIIDLEIWMMQWDRQTTGNIHTALEREREALVHEVPVAGFSLEPVRKAQRRAVKTGLEGRSAGQPQPTVTIEAYQVSST